MNRDKWLLPATSIEASFAKSSIQTVALFVIGKQWMPTDMNAIVVTSSVGMNEAVSVTF